MLRNLVTVTPEDIEESVNNCTKEIQSFIMHLQNTGDENHKWSEEDIKNWLYDDIDE